MCVRFTLPNFNCIDILLFIIFAGFQPDTVYGFTFSYTRAVEPATASCPKVTLKLQKALAPTHT